MIEITNNQLELSLTITTKEVRAKQWKKADIHINAIYEYYTSDTGAFSKKQEEWMFTLLDTITNAIYH